MRQAVGGTILAAVMMSFQLGCAVTQPPGNGRAERQKEPVTDTGYWLYLPEDYVKNDGRHPQGKRWPMVITFHGLRPYDSAKYQIREWQQEADRYGFIVIAPELRTCDSLTMQFPLRDPNLPYVKKDEQAIMTIMDEVLRRTNGDPNRVLATSFSSGGYIAHYIVNRYPERFSCIAVRGSNFNKNLLSSSQVPRYRDTPIGIFWGENDIGVCAQESKDAVHWYRGHNFDVEAKYVDGLGHERTPQTAAAFFASTIGVTPKTAPATGTLVMRDYEPQGRVYSSRRRIERTAAPRTGRSGSTANTVNRQQAGNGGIVFDKQSEQSGRKTHQVASPRAPQHSPPTVRSTPNRNTTRRRPTHQPYSSMQEPPAPRSEQRQNSLKLPRREKKEDQFPPAKIKVDGKKVGVAPMWINLGVEMPPRLQDGASILWTKNGKPMASGRFQARGVLRKPGQHTIEARIITADDRKITVQETIKVLPRSTSQPSDS
jgi:poly(3-hydroxybutyrate) depolymerase